MNFKFLVLTFSLSLYTTTHAATRNLCDDLADSSDTTEEQVKKCQDKIGVSDFYKSQELKRKTEQASKAKSNAIAAAKVDNVEIKKFSSDELLEAGFGKPFFAVTDDYRFGYKQERVTEGNALCTYLGYEKAVKSIISQEINQEDSNKKGLIVDSGIFGAKKAPDLYKQDNPKVGVRKYVEITCAKRKDKKAPGASDALKSVVEDLVVLDDAINAGPKDKTSQIVDDKRDSKTITTPHGYKTPDWMKDDNASGVAK